MTPEDVMHEVDMLRDQVRSLESVVNRLEDAVDRLRERLDSVVKNHHLWDGS